MRLTGSPMAPERGSVLITALVATLAMLVVGLGLLAVVDTQAGESKAERTRDHAFNLAESALTSSAFVLGRHWPDTGALVCSTSAAGVGAAVGATPAAGTPASFLAPNINASYTDGAYSGATWQVNVCDDVDGQTVWTDALLNNLGGDANANKKVWVRAQGTVAGRTRVLAGLVQVRTTSAFRAKYGLTAGRLGGDLGASVTALSTGALNGVLGSLLGTYPLVAPDPDLPAATPPTSGVTGLRCGLLDMADGNGSTCVLGTLGALGAIPLVSNLVTGGKFEQIPASTAASADSIQQMRSQAKATGTYTATTAGASTAAAAPACTTTGTPGSSTVVFIEKVGTGDQYCVLNLPDAGIAWKALIIGSGRVVLRGAGAVSRTTDTFNGVVYALNLQRHDVADGGLGLGDATEREVIRIEGGAHVNGAVNADGKSGKITVYEPLTINTNALVDALFPCPPILNCVLNGTLKALGVTALVDQLLTLLNLNTVVNALLAQLNPQYQAYGSAITSDVDKVNALSVYGASGVLPGTFRDLQSAS